MTPRVPNQLTPDWVRRISQSINGLLSKTGGFGQAAIADDASGAANQATVNAILAALRASGIIE